MLYVFHGTDVQAAGTKARALVESLRTKRPDASFVKIDPDSWHAEVVQSHLGGQGLFSSKYIVFLDRVTENSDGKNELPALVSAMQESTNIFIVLEGKVNAELKKVIEKSAEKIVETEKKSPASGFDAGGFNIFALSGAVQSRDSFKAWNLYRQAVDSGMESEAILGVLFWKAKTSGWNNFARAIITLYHDGHRGLRDLELGTEALLLNCGKRAL